MVAYLEFPPQMNNWNLKCSEISQLGERYTEDLMVLGSIPGFGNQSLSASHVV